MPTRARACFALPGLLAMQVNFLSHWLLANLLLQHERGRRAKAQAAAPALAAAGPKGGSGKPAALRLQVGALN